MARKPSKTLKHTLQILYIQTNTPKSANLLENDKLKLILDALRLKVNKSTGFPGITSEDCVDIVHFLLRLVDTPKSLRGLLALKPCAMYLINSAADQLFLLPEKDVNAIKDVASKFYEIIESSSKPQDCARYIAKPLLNNSSLAHFHYNAYHSCLLNDGSSPLYQAYGYFLHTRIRYNSHLGLEIKTVEDYIRSARYFFKYIPDNTKIVNQHPLEIPPDYIEEFVKGYNISETNAPFPLTVRAINYRRTFWRLILGWEGRPSPRLGRIPEDELEPVDGYLDFIDKDDLAYQNAAITVDESDFQHLEEPYPDIELGFIKRNPLKDILDKKPKLTRTWSDLVNLRSFHYPWDAKHLNLYHYALLYQQFGVRYGSKTKDDMMIICTLIMIHTGIHYKKLVTLIASDDQLPGKRLILRKIEERYYILCNSFVIRNEPLSNDHCHATSSIVHIPIPDEIINLFPEPPTTGSVFGYERSEGLRITLTGDDIKRFLRKITRPSDLNMRNTLRITPSKISSSFLTLYNMRAGLDELMCTYVSGHDYHRLYGSQAHYIHIPHRSLEKQYLSTFYAVNKLISDNYRSCVDRKCLNSLIKGNPAFLDILLKIKPVANLKINSVLPGYGSPIIVKDNYLYDVIRQLKQHIHKETNFIKKHNYFICYAYLALQLSTGMRPRNRPNLTWENFSEQLGAITIRDKASVTFHEVRTVPLTSCVTALLQNIRSKLEKLRFYVANHLNPSIFREDFSNIFFFINGKGRCVDFTLDNFMSLIRTIVPDYNLPANMPRHYLRNFLYHNGISNDAADAIFGHQHNGKELLNVISSTKPSDVGKVVLPTIEKMLKQLGIEEVKYG